MWLELDEIIEDAKRLPLVPLGAIAACHEQRSLLTKYVDDTLSAEQSIHDLIGNNPMQIMYDNHKHHAAFMVTVFSLGNYELLARTVPWVYRAYSGLHFSHAYFVLELKAWMQALDQYIAPNLTEEIKSIYAWMLNRHENMIWLSQSEKNLSLPIDKDWLERKNAFLFALLNADHDRCVVIAIESIRTGKDVAPFYQHIIQPVMYEIGMLWERGEISVAQEHMSSAIVSRVMATCSMVDTASSRRVRGKAVITSAPNEFHEIGAWMISDLLEQDGWEVRYLGANTPVNDLLNLLRSFRPDVLALSVTMPFNILEAKGMIEAVRKEKALDTMRIMVGGRPFNDIREMWRSIGADGFAANAEDAIRLADEWRIDVRS